MAVFFGRHGHFLYSYYNSYLHYRMGSSIYRLLAGHLRYQRGDESDLSRANQDLRGGGLLARGYPMSVQGGLFLPQSMLGQGVGFFS